FNSPTTQDGYFAANAGLVPPPGDFDRKVLRAIFATPGGSPLSSLDLVTSGDSQGTDGILSDMGVLHIFDHHLSIARSLKDEVAGIVGGGGGGSVVIDPAKTTPTIPWPSPADIAYGTPLSLSQLDATASVPGTFAYSPALGTVLNAGAGQTLSLVFTPDDP